MCSYGVKVTVLLAGEVWVFRQAGLTHPCLEGDAVVSHLVGWLLGAGLGLVHEAGGLLGLIAVILLHKASLILPACLFSCCSLSSLHCLPQAGHKEVVSENCSAHCSRAQSSSYAMAVQQLRNCRYLNLHYCGSSSS